MIGFVSKLFGGGAIETVGKIIDELHTSDEERLQAKNTIAKIEAELKKPAVIRRVFL